MVIESYTVQLERVQGLIKSIEESPWSTMTVGDRTTTLKQLTELYQRETQLRQKVAEENANSGVTSGPIRVRGVEVDV